MVNDMLVPRNNEEFSPSPRQLVKIILIVEDDEEMATVLAEVLATETAYQAIVVGTGLQAVELVHAFTPDLFLLDSHLPDMTGIQLYDQLHAIKRLEHIPAIMTSAHLPQREIKSRDIACLAKSFDLETFLSLLHALLD